jgi:hypothetical protein
VRDMERQREQREEDKSGVEVLTGNLQRGVAIIKDRVDVRWPAGHVELALIQLQRRRQHRRAVLTASMIGLGGLALALGWSGAMHTHGGVAARRLVSSLATPVKARIVGSVPSVTAPPSVMTPPVALATPVRPTVEAPPAAPEGHLLQQRLVPRREVAASRWVALAGQRRFGEAYGLLRQVPLREIAEPNDLMLAADVARQAGRPARAVPFLERVVKEHSHELCAQLAGFSLGKIYLDSMDDPSRAARTFAEVRAMAPTGGLAQDALAREVEAWARAGDTTHARSGATEYVRLYPNGRRVAAVRDLGGL